MEKTRLSSKGQVIIPKSIRERLHWHTGQVISVIETSDGVLLKPLSPVAPSAFEDVAGMLRETVTPKTDTEIEQALANDIKRRWHDRD